MRFSSVIAASCVYAAAASAQLTPVSDAVYASIRRYTQFASAAYSEDCPSPPFGSRIVSTVNSSTVDFKTFVFYDSSVNEVVVSFRGSAFPKNLDQDFQFAFSSLSISGLSCSGCQVHSGFQGLWNAISSPVTSAVRSALSANPGSSLTVTGHSLGAAIGALASTSFAAQGLNPSVWTLGEPRSGNAAWSNLVNGFISPSKYNRITYRNDGVPQIPPTVLGYQHHGTELWESGTTQATTYNCGTGEPTQCIASQNYGNTPINGAHITYPGTFLASVLFNPACGYVQP